jgi:CTP:molybdopterin cytidylyltransferase MocA
MGRPKPLLPWGSTSVLGHIIAQWQNLGAKQILIVTRSNDLLLAQELTRLGHRFHAREPLQGQRPLINSPLQRGEVVSDELLTVSAVSEAAMIHAVANPQPDRGMFSSIQCAARWEGWQPSIRSFGIVLADQPHLRTESLRKLLLFHAENRHAICQPSFDGRARHPVLMPKVAFEELRASSASDLKSFLRLTLCEKTNCAINDPGLAFDLNTPGDYERVRSRFQPEGLAEGPRATARSSPLALPTPSLPQPPPQARASPPPPGLPP